MGDIETIDLSDRSPSRFARSAHFTHIDRRFLSTAFLLTAIHDIHSPEVLDSSVRRIAAGSVDGPFDRPHEVVESERVDRSPVERDLDR